MSVNAGRTPERLPPPWDAPLTEADYATLATSWITRELVDQAELRRVNAVQGREVLGQKCNRDCAGILTPCYWPGEPMPFNYRMRCDNPEYVWSEDGKPKQDGKCLGPPKGSNRLYIPAEVTLEQLRGSTIPLVIVEGEKRPFVLWRLARHDAETAQFIPEAIAGAGQLSDARFALTAIPDRYQSRRGSLPAFRGPIAAETGP